MSENAQIRDQTSHWGLCKCQICGKPWIPRQIGRPARCPNCKSEYWDRPDDRQKKRRPKRMYRPPMKKKQTTTKTTTE